MFRNLKRVEIVWIFNILKLKRFESFKQFKNWPVVLPLGAFTSSDVLDALESFEFQMRPRFSEILNELALS